MELFHIFAGVLTLSAVFAYLNQRTLKLPAAIALMIVGLLLSLLILGLGAIFPAIPQWAQTQLATIDFSVFVLNFLLSFLLFAGALHTDLTRLAALKWPILSFATIGVITSTLLIAWATCGLMTALGQPIDFIYCLLFGALISPTDPIAVLGILKKAGVPKDIEIKITGESLFNDGVGVVVFLSLFHIAEAGGVVDTTFIVELLLGEIVGGVVLGLALGFVGFQLLKRIDHYPTEVMISLAIVMGGYSAALLMHFSGPLAMVVAGLWLGNKGHDYAMSDVTAD
jgi:CPA1 family monovalent cation:H+ antiporter